MRKYLILGHGARVTGVGLNNMQVILTLRVGHGRCYYINLFTLLVDP